MPDHVIKKVLKWGKKLKQLRSDRLTLEFLNFHREQVTRDDDVPDKDEGLIEPAQEDGMLPELPGIELASDHEGHQPFNHRRSKPFLMRLSPMLISPFPL